MRRKQTTRHLGFGLLLGLVAGIAMVSGPQESIGDPNWTGPDSDSPQFDPNAKLSFYYADPNEIVRVWVTLGLFANSNLLATHVMADCGHCLEHWHLQKDFADITSPDWLGPDDFDRYWDERFKECTRVSSASNKQNCHSWAFDTYSDPGPGGTPVYHYWINSMDALNHAYASDRGSFRTDFNDVEPNDFIQYDDGGYYSHTTVVESIKSYGCAGWQPAKLRWKYLWSGVYTYEPGDDYEWCTPMNAGYTLLDTPLSEQGWEWWPDYEKYLPRLWPDDDD